MKPRQPLPEQRNRQQMSRIRQGEYPRPIYNLQNPVLNQSPSALISNGRHTESRPQDASERHSHSHSNSQLSKRHSNSFLGGEKVIQLHERLKNLHLFYKNKIEQEKGQTVQRNNVFMGIIDEMQRSHQGKVDQLKKLIDETDGEKKDVGLVDERMNDIKGSIDEILRQSSELKTSNDLLQRQINEKEHTLREKQQQLSKEKEELMQTRTDLEMFERLNLKENKRSKEIVGMIDKTVQAHGLY